MSFTFIEKLLIPAETKKIGRRAFFGCTNLLCVEGMEGVEESGGDVFTNTKIVLSEENGYCIGGVVFGGKVQDGTLTLPGNARTIADNAFFCRDKIVKLEMPEGLENIGRSSFRDCFNLKELRFPASLKRLGGRAFYGCTDLVGVSFG